MAYEQVTAAHRLTYNENVQLAYQQKRSRFEMCCTYQPNLKGRQARVIELIGSEEAIEGGARGEDTPNIESRIEDVWMTPVQREWGKLVEKEDTIKACIDYTSPYVMTGAAAMQRAKDVLILQAVFADRRVGQDGTLTEVFNNPNGNVPVNYVKTGAAVNSGLTVPKIIRGVSLLSLTEDDDDEIFMAITNVQMEDLYNSITVTSKDFREKAVLDHATRTVMSFFGVTFIRTNARYLSMPTANVRRCPMWQKSRMHFAEFSPLETTIERNPQKKYRLNPYMEMYIGATRSEDAGVVEILCSEV